MFKQVSMLAISFFLAHGVYAQTYIVDRYQDDEAPGSLRWAINQSNTNRAEENQILIQAVNQPPYVIKIDRPLPKIQAPVKIIGTAWDKNGQWITLDGSNYIQGEGEKACPGATKGQYGTNVRTMTLPGLVLQDVNGITLRGLDVHRFCIGVLINRSSHNLIEHNRISNNYGGAGIMITGDDGQGNSTATTTINNKVINNQFIDNGDGLELTRGAAFNLIANNLFTSTKDNPEPSQGIEILWGNDNVIIGNTFKNYSDGLQINWGKRNYIAHNEATGNSLGFNLTGDGNILDRNRVHGNRIGIAIRSEKDANSHITLSKNEIWNNGQDIKRCQAGGSCVVNQRLGAIVFGVPALEHENFVGSRGGGVVIQPDNLQKTCTQPLQKNCNAAPNQNIQAPQLSQLDKKHLHISIHALANQRYTVEIFGNTKATAFEAEHFLDSIVMVTDAKGIATRVWPLPTAKVATVTANITNAEGATSELSSAVVLN